MKLGIDEVAGLDALADKKISFNTFKIYLTDEKVKKARALMQEFLDLGKSSCGYSYNRPAAGSYIIYLPYEEKGDVCLKVAFKYNEHAKGPKAPHGILTFEVHDRFFIGENLRYTLKKEKMKARIAIWKHLGN